MMSKSYGIEIRMKNFKKVTLTNTSIKFVFENY